MATLKKKIRNSVFYAFLIVLIAGIVVILINANREDTAFLEQQAMYMQASTYFSEGNYDYTQMLLDELENDHSNNEFIAYLRGITSLSLQQPDEGIKAFTTALDANPYLLENPVFIVAFLELLMLGGYEQDARTILTYAKNQIEKKIMDNFELIDRVYEIEGQLNAQ